MKDRPGEREPGAVEECQTGRMIMSQLGFIGQMFIKDPSSCLEIDSSQDSFIDDLKMLDKMSFRSRDNILSYFVRSGQTKPSEILSNTSVSQEYLDLLSSLGWLIDVKTHEGWSGGVNTKFSPQIRYWSDENNELAVLTPTTPIIDVSNINDQDQVTRRRVTLASSSSSNGSEFSRLFMSRRLNKVKNVEVQKFIVVWFENLEDSDKFPVKKLVTNTESISLMIFLQPLKNKMMLVRTVDASGEVRRVFPLVDGSGKV